VKSGLPTARRVALPCPVCSRAGLSDGDRGGAGVASAFRSRRSERVVGGVTDEAGGVLALADVAAASPNATRAGTASRTVIRFAQCANQISSDLTPKNAALHNYSELFTSTQAYISGVLEDVRSFVRMIGVDRFPRADLGALQEMANLIVAGPDGAR
jgi:hypothetical protein